ncbi:hypothetical protein WA158_007883 [Blastocystis sp. Blastoise]
MKRFFAAETTKSPEEIEKFKNYAMEWWNPNSRTGSGMLHHMNPSRLVFIDHTIENHFISSKYKGNGDLTNIDILDIGCGGGLLSEEMARRGANVIGIDPCKECIDIAQYHASLTDNWKGTLQYENSTVEDQMNKNKKYDIVFALEVIEHVSDFPFFMKNVSKLTKTGGLVIFSTINKTLLGWINYIYIYRYILHILPVGTHDYKKFISDRKLHHELEKNQFRLLQIKGILPNPITWNTHLVPFHWCFYICSAIKL